MRAQDVAQTLAAQQTDSLPAEVGPELGPPQSLRELMATFPTLREPVIRGLLRIGETMNVISLPKLGKSWLVIDLGLSICSGRTWLGIFETEAGDVLILDNELHGETIAHRVPKVAVERGIPIEAVEDRLHVKSLRGRLQDIFTLGSFFRSIEPGRYRVIILDAFYRFMPREHDENDNGTMASVYNQLDQYADHLGCSFVLIHHTTKGNQSGKAITDVGAGAGSQSRATDTHMILRPHREEGAVVLEAAVRSWPPPKPICLRWRFPVWEPAHDLDPTQLKSDRPKRKTGDDVDLPPEEEVKEFVQRFINEKPKARTQVLWEARNQKVSGRRAQALLLAAEESGLAHRWTSGRNRPVLYATVPKPDGNENRRASV